MVALQLSPIAFLSIAPPSAQCTNYLRAKLSLSYTFTKLPKLTNKLRPQCRGSVAAEIYASALADVAKSNGTLDHTAVNIEQIDKFFSDAEVSYFFTNPLIDDSKKHEIIDQIVASSNLQPHVSNFLNILVDMNRMDIINDIVKEFEIAYNKMTETEMAVVSSVVKLEAQQLAQIARGVQRLSGAKNVRIKTLIDPSLVAGFTIMYGNSGSKLIDMSVKKQLEDIASKIEVADVQLDE